jgi:hypothetical protein
MLRIKNLTHYKTTILGLLITVAAIAYPFFIEANPWIYGIQICVGLALLFLPDTLIDTLRRLLQTNGNKKF